MSLSTGVTGNGKVLKSNCGTSLLVQGNIPRDVGQKLLEWARANSQWIDVGLHLRPRRWLLYLSKLIFYKYICG